jgi:hypothetical protein
MKPKLMSILVTVSIVAVALLAIRWQMTESKLRETRRWTHFVMDSLGTSINLPAPPEGPQGRDSVYWQWVATSAQIQSRRWQQAVRHWVQTRADLLSDGDIAYLKQDGLADPSRQLRDSLVTHTELIPEATTHGRMMIAPGENIVLLESPYVMAQYDDGLNGGHMLLEYKVLPGPRIEWKRLWWARD